MLKVLCRYIIKSTGIFLYALISVQCFRFLKPVFHFNRIGPKRSVFRCFLSGSLELITSTQKKMLWFVTIEVETGLKRLTYKNDNKAGSLGFQKIAMILCTLNLYLNIIIVNLHVRDSEKHCMCVCRNTSRTVQQTIPNSHHRLILKLGKEMQINHHRQKDDSKIRKIAKFGC